MSIKYVLLGFLSETPLTGYDLKKRVSSSPIFPWSGNSNQIYRALVELHDDQLVTLETRQQENKPPRKIYTITDAGRAALQQWMLTAPELPTLQHPLLTQLNWADQLEPTQLDAMLAQYEDDLRAQVLMLREGAKRLDASGFKARIAEHWQAFYQRELDWVITLRHTLTER